MKKGDDDAVPYMHERMTLEDVTSPDSTGLHSAAPPGEGVMTPCTIEGMGPALAAGVMGYVIGAGMHLQVI